MQLYRENHQLVIRNYTDTQLHNLKKICFFDYKISSLGKVEHKFLTPYKIENGSFITSMGFLHEIWENFPDAETIIRQRDNIIIPFKPTKTLWKEQQKMLGEWYKNKKRGTIEVGTGSGKTLIGIYAIKMLSVPTIIIVPTDVIQKDTWYKMMTQDFGIPSKIIGFFGGRIDGKTIRQIRPLTISTYKSAYLKIDELKGKFEFMIADEVHHICAETYKNIALGLDCLYTCGLSATTARQDMNHPLIFKTVGKLIKGPPMEELEKNKKVAPMEHKVFFVNLTEKERNSYEHYKAITNSASREEILSLAREEELEEILEKLKRGIKSVTISFSHKARDTAMGAINKLPIVHQLVLKHYKSKILIFSVYLKHLDTLYKLLYKHFSVAILTHKIGDRETKKILENFHSGKIKILLSAFRIEEGLNVPSADIGIIIAGHGIKRQKIQRSGRIRRYFPFKVAKLYEIVARDTDDERLYKRRMKSGD